MEPIHRKLQHLIERKTVGKKRFLILGAITSVICYFIAFCLTFGLVIAFSSRRYYRYISIETAFLLSIVLFIALFLIGIALNKSSIIDSEKLFDEGYGGIDGAIMIKFALFIFPPLFLKEALKLLNKKPLSIPIETELTAVKILEYYRAWKVIPTIEELEDEEEQDYQHALVFLTRLNLLRNRKGKICSTLRLEKFLEI